MTKPNVLGSCSLHVVHGAFQTGAQQTGWNIDSLLRSLYNLFHDAPARAEDFVNITGSTQFPRKFCSTRWLEDAPVAERAIMIWPNIVKYVNETLKGPKGKVPKIQSFNTVQASTQDPFITAKRQFFVTQANMLQPYLQKHQMDDPMAAFMAQDLAYIVRSAMSKFVKKDVIDTASSSAKLVNIELEKEDNLLPPKDVDVGFAVKAITEKLQKDRKVSQLQIRSFFSECQTFLKAATAKILERCPLKYQLVRSLSALDPRHMALQPDDATRKFERLLAKLLMCRQFKADECDGAKRQFDVLLAEVQKYHKEEFEAYTTCQRLDKFFFKVLAEKPHYNVLWKVVKLVLVLSHGQAGIERGFSENKDILSCNMGEDTVKAYRTVYDGVKHMKCEFHDILVSKELLKSCKQSRQRYSVFLEDQKKAKKDSEAESNKQKLLSELKECQKKEKRLQSEASALLDKADNLCAEAEKSHKWNLIIEANALRAKGKQKRKEADEAKNEAEVMTKKLKFE